MRRILTAVLFLLMSLAVEPAAAARLDVFASSSAVHPGQPLSITVTGDSEGALSLFITAGLDFSGDITPQDAVGPFSLDTSSSNNFWDVIVSEHGRCGVPLAPDGCVAASAYVVPIFEIPIDLLPSTLSVFAFNTSSVTPGSVLTFQATPTSPGSFFDAGPSDLVTVDVIPEPATALLLASGLAALAARRRIGPRVGAA